MNSNDQTQQELLRNLKQEMNDQLRRIKSTLAKIDRDLAELNMMKSKDTTNSLRSEK